MNCIYLPLLLVLHATSSRSAHILPVELDTSSVAGTTSDYFLSFTIDAGAIKGHLELVRNFTSRRLLNMARELSPAVWRIGGTSQDYIVFNVSSKEATGINVVMSTEQWDQINRFARDAGLHLIFGLSALIRQQNGRWEPSNALQLMEYTSKNGYAVSWELGNEPDLFSKRGACVKAVQLAQDFQTLRQILGCLSFGEASKDGHYHVKLAGPDIASLTGGNYFSDFLQAVGDGVVDAVTWHQYYKSGAKAKVEDFYSSDLLDRLIGQLAKARNLTEQYVPSAEIWLGETSSAYNGGAVNLSDTFIAGNLWLDKLGLAALHNHTVVCRQALVGGYYSLLDSNFYPLPDYYTSVLYKRLVSSRVLYVKDSLKPGRLVRVYAHCSNQTTFSNGHVTFIVINLINETIQVQLPDSLAQRPVYLYLLTPGGGDILSKQVMLNGKILELDENDKLPDLSGKRLAAHAAIAFPGLTYGYIVTGATVAACM